MGAVLALCSLALLGAGGVALRASTTQRHGGDINLGTWGYRSSGYAVASSTEDPYGAAGPGTQTLTWPDRNGNWTVVAMNADGSRPVAVRISVAAALPSLPWIAAGLLVGGILMLAAGVPLIAVPARHAASHRTEGRA